MTDRSDNGVPVVCLGNGELTRARELYVEDRYFWLELHSPSDETIGEIGELFGLHPLTVEDVQHFGQRPKIEPYPVEEYVYVVFYGAAPADDDDRLAEIHIVHSERFMLTIRRDDSVALAALQDRVPNGLRTPVTLLHSVLDALVDSFGPVLDDLDDSIEYLEDAIFRRDLKGREADIHRLRQLIGKMNRTVHAESESFTRMREALVSLHGEEKMAPYFRDVQDHLIRVADSADSLRDRLSTLSELYIAALDMKLNVVMKQFTVIAGIFLPLTWIVGIFGQNFGWMVEHVDTRGAFLLWGVAVPVVVVAGLLLTIWRRGFFHE